MENVVQERISGIYLFRPKFLPFFLLFVLFSMGAAGQTNYYSKSTGSLSTLATWGVNTNGSGASPASFTAANQIFNIRNQASPTITAAWTVTGAGSKVIVGDGASACNFTIPSTFAVSTSTLIDVSNAGTLTISNATIPNLGTLNANSTVNFSLTANQTIPAKSYGNLIISGSANKTLGGTITVAGDFTLSGSANFVQNNLSASNAITISGDMNLTSSGTYDFNTSLTGSSNVSLAGNYNNTGCILTTSGFGTSTPNGKIIFTGPSTVAAPQTYTNTPVTNNTFVNFDVASGAVLELKSNLPLTRSVTYRGILTVLNGGTLNLGLFAITEVNSNTTCTVNLNAGGTLITSNATGLTGSFPGANTTEVFDNAGNYEFRGVSTGTFPNTTMNDLTINNASTTTTTAQALTVNGNLAINASNIFNVGTNAIAGTVASTSGTGTLRTQNTTATPIPTGKTWNFNTQFDGVGQTVPQGSYDGGLTMSGGTKTFATGPTNVGGNWTSASSSTINLSTNNVTINFDGVTNQTITDAGSNGGAGVVFRAINFSNAGTKTFSGNTSVFGNWTSTGGEVDFLTNNVTVNFTGTAAQSLSDAGSDSGAGIVFNNVNFSGAGTKTMSATGSGKFSVAGSGVLTMAASTQLASGGVLYLKSVEDFTASVAAIPNTSIITGDVFVERFMKGGNDNARRGYRLLSSAVHPVASATNYNVFNLKQNTYITGSPDAANIGASSAGNASLFDWSPNHNPTIYRYSEPVSGGVSPADYIPIGLPLTNNVFRVGEGMYFFFRGLRSAADVTSVSRFSTSVKPEDNTLVYSGVLNQQNYSPALTYTNTANAADGYNLVGNPYPSTIDLQSANITYTNLTNFIYVLNPQTKVFGVADRTGAVAATGGASRYIASGQGFFVKANAASPAITFRETAKVTNQLKTAVSPILLMGIEGVQNAVIKPQMFNLKMINEVDSNAQDDIVIAFNPSNKQVFDEGEDAFDMGGNGTTFLSSFSSDNIKLAINSYPAIQKDTKVRLSAISTLGGNFKLVPAGLESLDKKYQAYLVDKYKADTVKLSDAVSYNFNINRAVAESYGDNRFEVIFDEKPLLTNTVLNFYGAAAGRNVNLGWKINSNPKPVKYTLQKSIDGINFTKLISLDGDDRTVYNAVDSEPAQGDNFYRLVQTDLNGQTSYSNIVNVKFSTSSSISIKGLKIYPNPVVNKINIDLEKNYIGEIFVKVIDVYGRVLVQKTSTSNTFSLDLSKLNTGTYIIELINNNISIGRSKILKL
ncbi:T9SS type A sorting domain-containing protein [Pedobacter sandarakinus]|uniref:T9SS type A sorting domain-containing protein n=1 Tax=Pedobacter sandarakinus TaxID=353156 RepID=UPI002247355E|nr:T9SS type A sorting domain-containing protein [Pedobacter sandarakinus]MCX2575901.1 T9SS type A sorting domain-containing protein [Pedobacter sandarakinus]